MSWRGEEETPRVRNESTFGCAPPTYYNSQQAPLACQARREMLTYLSSAGNFEWQWGTGDQWVADTPRFFRGDHGLLGRTTVASGAGSHEGECFGGVGGARRPQEASPGLRRIKDEAPVASWAWLFAATCQPLGFGLQFPPLGGAGDKPWSIMVIQGWPSYGTDHSPSQPQQ